ncbi:MAG: Rieske (2Fe-2S) protein [Gemmatimonadota bacterium]
MLGTVARAGLAVCGWSLTGGCGAAEVTAPSADASDDVRVTADEIQLNLARVPALTAVGGAYVVGAANVIVLRVGEREYRAFSNVCTHAGCGIYIFRDARMQCQCHGSEFDTDGRNVAGPAPSPLMAYPVTLDADRRVLRVLRTVRSTA